MRIQDVAYGSANEKQWTPKVRKPTKVAIQARMEVKHGSSRSRPKFRARHSPIRHARRGERNATPTTRNCMAFSATTRRLTRSRTLTANVDTSFATPLSHSRDGGGGKNPGTILRQTTGLFVFIKQSSRQLRRRPGNLSGIWCRGPSEELPTTNFCLPPQREEGKMASA